MPLLIVERRWSCAAAVELTKWVKVFRKAKHVSVASGTINLDTAEARLVFDEICLLRHSAVHRLPLTAKRVCKLLTAAVALAKLLDDESRRLQLERLEFEVQSKTNAMELCKKVLEDTVCGKLAKIELQRKKLDLEERDTIQKAVKEDRESEMLVGKLLLESMPTIFSPTPVDAADDVLAEGENGDSGQPIETAQEIQLDGEGGMEAEQGLDENAVKNETDDSCAGHSRQATGQTWSSVFEGFFYGYSERDKSYNHNSK